MADAEHVSRGEINDVFDFPISFPINRRDLLRSAGFVAGAAATSRLFAAPIGPEANFLPFLNCIGEIIIPTTKTPGAGAPEVSAFVVNASKVGIIGSTIETVPQLLAQLDSRANGSFMALPKTAQTKLIQLVDNVSFLPGASLFEPWPTVKALIVMGYYTSEVGGSQELAYELIPGRYDPDIPTKTRALSNDWSGLSIQRGPKKK